MDTSFMCSIHPLSNHLLSYYCGLSVEPHSTLQQLHSILRIKYKFLTTTSKFFISWPFLLFSLLSIFPLLRNLATLSQSSFFVTALGFSVASQGLGQRNLGLSKLLAKIHYDMAFLQKHKKRITDVHRCLPHSVKGPWGRDHISLIVVSSILSIVSMSKLSKGISQMKKRMNEE